MAKRSKKKKQDGDQSATTGPLRLGPGNLHDFVQSFTRVDYSRRADADAIWPQDCIHVMQYLVRSQQLLPGRGEIVIHLIEGATFLRVRIIELPGGGLMPATTTETVLEDSGAVARRDVAFWRQFVDSALIRIAPRLVSETEIQARLVRNNDPERIVLGRRT